MKIFRDELSRRRDERRQKRSSTWGGLLIKIAVFLLVLMLVKFILSPSGERFGAYWKSAFQTSSEVVEE